MAASSVLRRVDENPVYAFSSRAAADVRLADLSQLANVDIETQLVADLSGALHAVFDSVSEDALPIYFGPLLGRLYLQGL